jgi:hypothetical protein
MKRIPIVIEVMGMAAVVCGAYQLAPWLGWIVAGALAVFASQAGGRET